MEVLAEPGGAPAEGGAGHSSSRLVLTKASTNFYPRLAPSVPCLVRGYSLKGWSPVERQRGREDSNVVGSNSDVLINSNLASEPGYIHPKLAPAFQPPSRLYNLGANSLKLKGPTPAY